MCGRYALYGPVSRLRERFSANIDELAADFGPRYNAAPMQLLPVVRQRPSGESVVHLLRWGLIPGWAKDETIATRLIEIEREVDDLKSLHLDNARAVEQAKAAVEANSIAVQEKLTERQKLLGQLDQAKMQEQMNAAMAQLSETVGQDVPTFDEVREKIEARYAKATGMAELSEGTVENRMLEVERATRSTEAHARLDAMREQLGLSAGDPEPAAPAEDPPAEG